MFKSLLQKYREIFSNNPPLEIEEQDVMFVLKNIDENKIIIKSLMDNELIDEDEYLNKLRLLVGEENKIKKSEASTKNFADVILVNQKGDVFLLQRSKESKMFPGMWGLPGGHVDEGETSIEAAKRELKEETNIDALSLTRVFNAVANDGGIIDYFIGTTKEELKTIILDNNEHYNEGWFNAADRKGLEMIPALNDKINKILEENQDLINTNIREFVDKPDLIEIFTINNPKPLQVKEDMSDESKLFLESKEYNIIKSYFDEGKITEDLFLDFLMKGGKGSGPRKTGDIEKDSEDIKESTTNVADQEELDRNNGIAKEKEDNLSKLKKSHKKQLTDIARKIGANGSYDLFRKNLSAEIQMNIKSLNIKDFTNKEIRKLRDISTRSNK